MEWSDALQLIELYEKRPYLCDKVAACNWTVATYATLSHDFVAHSRDKIARENCRCDIGLTFDSFDLETSFWIWVKFTYQGHRVKVKVTEAKFFSRSTVY